MRWFNLCIVLAASFFFASCSSGNFLDYKKVAEKYNLPKSVEPGDYPEDDGVVLLSITDINMELYSHSITTEETVHKMKKLFKNIEKYAFVEIDVYDSEKLDKISARTIKADGTSIVIKPEEFYESTGKGDESVFYSDKKTIKFTFPSVEKNCIIEYEYTKTKSFPFMTDVWYIHNSLPTLVNTYTLSIPKILMEPRLNGGAGWNWNYKTHNYFLDNPVVDAETTLKDLGKEKVIYRWSLKNVEPFKEEVLMPPTDDYIGYVKFAPSDWKQWKDISEWYYKRYFEPQLIITSDIRDLALKLTSGTENKNEKIRRLYDYVKKIRYVAISLGSGSIKPNAPAEILKKQYGDCKDKSILLISLLKAVDIDSKPVLVLTSDEGHIDPNFPSWNFNHMIVQASGTDKEKYWLDPTAKYTTFGTLPSACEDINVLVLNADYTSQIETTTGSKAEDNIREFSLKLDLKDGGSADFNAEIKFHGTSNSNIRYSIEDKTDKELKEYCKSLIADEFTNTEITNCEISDLDSLSSVYCLKFKGSAGNIVQNQGDLVLVASDPFKFFENTSWLLKDKRDYPIKFDYPFSLNKIITINLPSGYSVRNLPGKMIEVTGDLDYSKDVSKKDNSIVLNEKFRMGNSIIPASKYDETKTFFEAIKNRYGQKIILMKN
jgi:hypothetical protein